MNFDETKSESKEPLCELIDQVTSETFRELTDEEILLVSGGAELRG